VSAFVSLFGVVVAPWISIVIVGHFLRRGSYDAEALQVFNRGERGGIYWYVGGWNLRAAVSWLVASIVGLLFLTTSLYVGPWSDAANGIDLSWLSAMVLGALLYFIATRVVPEPPAVLNPALSTDAAAPITSRNVVRQRSATDSTSIRPSLEADGGH